MTAKRMLRALVSHFDWFNNRIMTEWNIGGGRADLIVVSRVGYVTEIEIKVTRGDWESDREKEKWNPARTGDLYRGIVYGTRKDISKFFYAVPEELADRIPIWVPLGVGIVAVDRGKWGDEVRVVRKAVRSPARKLTDGEWNRLRDACYMRFWRLQTMAWRKS